MSRREHGHALRERQPRHVRDLPEAVAVLEEELFAVDLDELTAVGRRGGHGFSIAGARAWRRRRRYSSPGSSGSMSRTLPAPLSGVRRPSSALARLALSERRSSARTVARMTSVRTGFMCVFPLVPPPNGG